MKTKNIATVAVLSLAIVAACFVLVIHYQPSFTASSGLPVYGQVANFKLTERSGRKVGLDNLKNKVWIATFIFTRCAGPCPLVTSHMSQLQTQLAGEKNLKLVSFSVDPTHDTPEVLKKYAERYHADPDRWWFLTGDKKVIRDLAVQYFHLGISDIPPAEQKGEHQTVLHSTKLVLVDGKGRIRGYYSSSDESALQAIAEDARKLTREL